MDTCEQIVFAERFGKIPDDAGLQGAFARPFVGKGGDENGRNGLTGRDQSIMELESGHSRHLHICNQAGHAATAPGFEEILGAFERHGIIAQRPDEARQSFSYRVVVVDDRYEGCSWQSRSLVSPKIILDPSSRHCYWGRF